MVTASGLPEVAARSRAARMRAPAFLLCRFSLIELAASAAALALLASSKAFSASAPPEAPAAIAFL